jgi:hypothetical protein
LDILFLYGARNMLVTLEKFGLIKNFTEFDSKTFLTIIKKIRKFLQNIFELLLFISDFELNINVGVQLG